MIYLDNAATTKPAKEVTEAMLPWMSQWYGNPSAIYGIGAKAKKKVNEVRRLLAASIGAKEGEIFFTSGGTESDNWAIKAIAEKYSEKGKHIITCKVEHKAVLNTCSYLEKRGYTITYLPVDEYGLIDPKEVEKAIRPDTILISIMFANNEVGTIQPIAEIGKIARQHQVIFHTDAVQAYGHVKIDVNELCVDLLSTSAHKIHGPKGMGFLYVRENLKIDPLLHGGGQERGYRSGTENVAAIAGFGAAVEKMLESFEKDMNKVEALREETIKKFLTEIPECRLNGHPTKRLPGNIHLSFPGVEGESLLIMLDMKGICASSGSACTAGSTKPSHVLVAMGLSETESKGSLRLTMDPDNTREEMEQTVQAVREIVARLRSMTGYGK